ncbi:uncharacterized protein EDB93DRAFT_639967 [Suillus bovinus]|uniref:uncharacterized protein n=1 Tax=Suillus bovinus TaxID=48563 RepID=UPI001B87EBFF|nr:uncharacterized protein EDB93DRAFT_639967 [Suillus bovinus]KAG2141155.1 hypothetical protein EDB93DRAFT_639967 [Suillus bovinus]
MADRHLYLYQNDWATIIPILPKPSQRSIERNWHPGMMSKVPDSINLCTFMDPAQNLFAVAYVDQIHETFFIDLTTLDNGSFHPQAAGPTLYIALQRASSEHRRWQLQIWDWQHSTTSDSVLRISDKYSRNIEFCFLGNDRLLVVAHNLELYSIEDMSHTPQLLASFVLPVRLRGRTTCLLPVDGVACSSQMQAQQTTYTSDPKHRLLCINMALFADFFIVYIISTRIFFDLPEIAVAMPIPWKCWGPSNTRIIWHLMSYDECKVHLSGNRVLLLFQDHEPIPISERKCKLCIMDFSPLAVTNRRGLGKVVIKPSTLDATYIRCSRDDCEDLLTTFLPYVEVVLDRKFGMHELKNIWIDQDRIYLLSKKLNIEIIDV